MKKDYSALALKLHNIYTLILLSDKKLKLEYPQFEKLLRDTARGDLGALKQLKDLVNTMLTQLEEIKKYCRKSLYKRSMTFLDVVDLLERKHVLDESLSKHESDIAHEIQENVRKDIKRHKKMRKKTNPLGNLLNYILSTKKRIKLEIKAVKKLKARIHENRLKYRVIRSKLTSSNGSISEEDKVLITNYLVSMHEEFSNTFYLMKNDEAIESGLINDLKTLTNSSYNAVAQTIKELEEKYKKQLTRNKIQDKKLLSAFKHIFKPLERQKIILEEYVNSKYAKLFTDFVSEEDLLLSKRDVCINENKPSLSQNKYEKDEIKHVMRQIRKNQLPHLHKIRHLLSFLIKKQKDLSERTSLRIDAGALSKLNESLLTLDSTLSKQYSSLQKKDTVAFKESLREECLYSKQIVQSIIYLTKGNASLIKKSLLSYNSKKSRNSSTTLFVILLGLMLFSEHVVPRLPSFSSYVPVHKEILINHTSEQKILEFVDLYAPADQKNYTKECFSLIFKEKWISDIFLHQLSEFNIKKVSSEELAQMNRFYLYYTERFKIKLDSSSDDKITVIRKILKDNVSIIQEVFSTLKASGYKTTLASDIFNILLYAKEIHENNCYELVTKYNITNFGRFDTSDIQRLMHPNKNNKTNVVILSAKADETASVDIRNRFLSRTLTSVKAMDLETIPDNYNIFFYEVNSPDEFRAFVKAYAHIDVLVISGHGTPKFTAFGFSPSDILFNETDSLTSEDWNQYIKKYDDVLLDIADTDVFDKNGPISKNTKVFYYSCSVGNDASGISLVTHTANNSSAGFVKGPKVPVNGMAFVSEIVDGVPIIVDVKYSAYPDRLVNSVVPVAEISR